MIVDRSPGVLPARCPAACCPRCLGRPKTHPATKNTRTTPRKPAKPRGKRQPLPADLPRVEIVYAMPEDERTCPCGCTMAEIGESVREELDIIPMQIWVLRYVCKRYACSRGDSAPRTAPAPPQVLPKTNASNNTTRSESVV